MLFVVQHREDKFADYISQFIGFLFTLAYLWPVSRVV